jgi:hypothetical protein
MAKVEATLICEKKWWWFPAYYGCLTLVLMRVLSIEAGAQWVAKHAFRIVVR